MKLRYTRQALADLDEARSYIAERNPEAAAAMADRIRTAIGGLTVFPDRGRPGRISGTRELVIPATPFVVVQRDSEIVRCATREVAGGVGRREGVARP